MMERFERLSELFLSMLINPLWKACGDVEQDGWASLRVFLSVYAFERQGRSPDYAPAAADMIDEIREMPLRADAASRAWTRFAEKLNNKGLNPRNNPLCQGGGKMSAVAFAATLPQPMVAWARDMIGGGRVREGYKALQKIRGIGPKIAAFFLRDVAVRYNIAPQNDRHLLQPVDTWVEFVVRSLSGDVGMDPRSCAEYLVEHAAAPERANQGIWYFCTQVAGSSRYVVRRCLEDATGYDVCLDKHLANLDTGAKAVCKFKEQGQ